MKKLCDMLIPTHLTGYKPEDTYKPFMTHSSMYDGQSMLYGISVGCYYQGLPYPYIGNFTSDLEELEHGELLRVSIYIKEEQK